ncbi:hypothetical protein GF327_09565 [Candidatus Woesearchaeota archaeon]|nr:hypothetical protein [Candidatus Woesearchaeota archaeon]
MKFYIKPVSHKACMKSNYDVIIVGAGPAGLYLGTQLASLEKRILIMDKQETLSPKAEYTMVKSDFDALEDMFEIKYDPDEQVIYGNDANIFHNSTQKVHLSILDKESHAMNYLDFLFFNLDSQKFLERLVDKYLDQENYADLALGTEYISHKQKQGRGVVVTAENANRKKIYKTKLLIDASGKGIQDYPEPFLKYPIVGGLLKIKEPLPNRENSWKPVIDKKGYFTNDMIFGAMDSASWEIPFIDAEGNIYRDMANRPIIPGWMVCPISKNEAIIWLVCYQGQGTPDIRLEHLWIHFNKMLPKMFNVENVSDIGDLIKRQGVPAASDPFSPIKRSLEDRVYGIGGAVNPGDILTVMPLANMFREHKSMASSLIKLIDEDKLSQENLNSIDFSTSQLELWRRIVGVFYPILISQDKDLWKRIFNLIDKYPELASHVIERHSPGFESSKGGILEKARKAGKAVKLMCEAPLFLKLYFKLPYPGINKKLSFLKKSLLN